MKFPEQVLAFCGRAGKMEIGGGGVEKCLIFRPFQTYSYTGLKIHEYLFNIFFSRTNIFLRILYIIVYLSLINFRQPYTGTIII